MDLRKGKISQWVAHLPDLPKQGQRGRVCTPVEAGGHGNLVNELEGPEGGSYKVEPISSRQAGRSVDLHMEEAVRIYKSYVWRCKNLAWLFSDKVPDWLDTDPAEWHAVRRILQEFKHHDFVRQFSRAKKRVETIQTERNYSETESTDPYDFPDVKIVCRKDSSQNFKSCLKIQGEGYLGTSIIKMVVVGSIDIELFALTEDEIDWKSIPLSLERVEINGKCIRDISKREMNVRKLYEIDLYTVKTLDGEDLATVESRRELCELYNQKLREEMADYYSPNSSELPAGDEVFEQTGEISKGALFKEVEIIPPHKSTRQTMIDRMKEANRPHSKNDQLSCDERGGNTAHSLTNVTKTGDYKPTSEPMLTPAAEYHTNDLVTFPRKIEGSTTIFTRHNSQRSLEYLHNLPNDTKTTIQQSKKDAHGEITEPASVASLDDSTSENNVIEQDNKRIANKQIIPSSSLQSLDELLNEALEAEEDLERRRAEKSSTKIKSPSVQENSIAELQIVNGHLVNGEQSLHSPSGSTISPMDNFDTMTIPDDSMLLKESKEATVNAPQADLYSQDLHSASKQGENADRSLATESHQSNGSQRALRPHRVPVLQGETPSRNLTLDKISKEKAGHLEYCERPKSRRGCAVPRQPLETYCQSSIKCSLDKDVVKTADLRKDLPPSRCWSNISLFSELSADDWVLLHQRNTDLNKSTTTSIPEVHISSQERSQENSPDSADCQNLTIPQERSRHNHRFNFFRRHFSSFRMKLRQLNCFSKS